MLGRKRVKVEIVLRVVERLKKRNPLNVVPVIVGEENVCFDTLVPELREKLFAERAQAGAAVEDQDLTLGAANLDAGGISSVTKVFRGGSGGGAANSPKSYFHTRLFRGSSTPA